MKKVSLDTWIQLLGMVGLLGGLIFVGLEMKQSQLIALAGQQHRADQKRQRNDRHLRPEGPGRRQTKHT